MLFLFTVKPVSILFGVPVKGKHSLKVLKHVLKSIRSKTFSKLSLMTAVCLLVRSGVFIKVPAVIGVSELIVLKNVIEVEGEALMGSLSVPPTEVCRCVTELVIVSSSGFI